MVPKTIKFNGDDTFCRSWRHLRLSYVSWATRVENRVGEVQARGGVGRGGGELYLHHNRTYPTGLARLPHPPSHFFSFIGKLAKHARE